MDLAPKAGIDSPTEFASFLAQLAHESVEFTHLEENLNYSAIRLMQVWPRRFPTMVVAETYAHDPQRLANLVYANRIGNGGPETGDGWRYRGRGPIQLTGRGNYANCGQAIGEDLLRYPDYLLKPSVGIEAACWYWLFKDLDVYDDDEDVRAETKLINGSDLGLAARQNYFNRILEAIQ